MKNTFIEELKKYERKALDPKLTRQGHGKGQCTTNLRDLMSQVTELKKRMAGFRPLLSDDIIVAFESLLWIDFILWNRSHPLKVIVISECIKNVLTKA